MIVVNAKPHSAAIDAIEKRLTEMGKGDSMNTVLKKAINEVAGVGKKEIWKGVKRKYTLKGFTAGDVKKKSYSARNPSAMISVTGPVLGALKNYETLPNTDESAAMLRVFRAGALKALQIHNTGSVYKAFVARMKSDHVGIFQRVPEERMKSNPKKQAIKEIMSLSKSKAAEMVYEQNGLHSAMQEEMVVRLHKHMNAVIGGTT